MTRLTLCTLVVSSVYRKNVWAMWKLQWKSRGWFSYSFWHGGNSSGRLWKLLEAECRLPRLVKARQWPLQSQSSFRYWTPSKINMSCCATTCDLLLYVIEEKKIKKEKGGKQNKHQLMQSYCRKRNVLWKFKTKVGNVRSCYHSVWMTVPVRPLQPLHKCVSLIAIHSPPSGWTEHPSFSFLKCPCSTLDTFLIPCLPDLTASQQSAFLFSVLLGCPAGTLEAILRAIFLCQVLQQAPISGKSKHTANFVAIDQIRHCWFVSGVQPRRFNFTNIKSSRKQGPCKRKHSTRNSGNKI